MCKRYEPLPHDAAIFRSVKTGGGFLPPGHVLPKPEWLEPTSDDVAEAVKSGRLAGLSVWNLALANHDDACWWRAVAPEGQSSFKADVADLKKVSTNFERPLEAVTDPLPTADEARLTEIDEEERRQRTIAAGGHALLEGIKRAPGTAKRDHKSFREELARQFWPG